MCCSLRSSSLMENLNSRQLVNFQILAEQFIKENISKMKGKDYKNVLTFIARDFETIRLWRTLYLEYQGQTLVPVHIFKFYCTV